MPSQYTRRKRYFNERLISVVFPHDKYRSSIAAPPGFKKNLDAFLEKLYQKTGVHFSRNEFIIKSIIHYYEHLSKVMTTDDMVKEIDETK